MEDYKLMIESKEYNQKVLDFICNGELDRIVDNTIFKENDDAKQQIMFGMSLAAMLTSSCEPYRIVIKD